MQSFALVKQWLIKQRLAIFERTSNSQFKRQLASRYFTPIYKVTTESIKKNVKLLFPVVHCFEASLTYLNIALHFVSVTCSPLKKPVCSQFSTAES